MSSTSREALLKRWNDSTSMGATAPSIPRRPAGSPAPLSFAQQRLWLLDQLSPGTLAYQMFGVFHPRGPLDAAALEQSLEEIGRRHELLRTTFVPGDDGPIQQISSHPALPLRRIDLTAAPESRLAEATRLATEEVQRPFDLAVGPLLRACLIVLGPKEHVLVFTMHHIVSDGWSLGVLFTELAAIYSARCERRAPALPELPIQYADYAVWQRQRLRGETLERQLGYWRQQLRGAPPALEIPVDFPRPALQRFRGARHAFEIPGRIVDALAALGRTEGASLFMALLAVFQVLLHRSSDQDDVVVGIPVAGRTRTETMGLIGPFANTLVLRHDLSGAPTFRELLRRTRKVCLDAYDHQEFPFERLVEELHPARDLSRNPIFQVLMVLQNTPAAGVFASPGTTSSVLPVDAAASMLDLSLELVPRPGGLDGVFEYSTDLFEPGTISRMALHLVALGERFATDPDASITRVSLLSAEERRQILLDWNATGRPLPEALSLHGLVEAQVARTPDAPAVVFEGERLTFLELDGRANRLAHHLRNLGVGPEARVAVCLERSLDLIVTLLAILKAGGAYVPLDPAYPAERLAFMLEDSRAHTVVVHASTASVLPPTSAPVVDLGRAAADLARAPEVRLPVQVEENNLAYLIYTSGSTGRPKGAMNTHRAIANRLLWMQEAYKLGAGDCVLQKTPVSFDVSVWELFWPLAAGARLVLAKPGGHQDNGYLVELIAREQVTTVHFVPSMLQIFLEEPLLERVTSLRQVVCSGEALPLELQRRFRARLPGPALHNLYGPTEAAVDVSAWTCGAEEARGAVPIGRPISNLQIYVLDRHLEPVPTGVRGELYIGGVGLARGYHDRPDLTAERFVPHPFADAPGARLYRTGDLARFWSDGRIEYVGRTDHQVKLRGFRIELGEIEAALARHPSIREGVAILRRRPSGDSQLVAYVALQAGKDADAGALRAYLMTRLPEHMVPSAFVVLERLPLTPSGKVDRAALPAPAAPSASSAASHPPRSALEQGIAAVWREALALEQVGIHDNFFDLGGHSLLLAQVHRRLRSDLGRELSMLELFQHPTIHGLAEYLGAAVRTPPGSRVVDALRARTEAQRAAIQRQGRLRRPGKKP
jgi:amino acid adenylation domain-containing protein